MGYEPYVSPEYYRDTYQDGAFEEDAELVRYLRQASRHIDSLTYNRIVGRGFSTLTGFQQELIQEVACQQVDFEYENADMIDTVLQNYSINGVAMQFGGSWNVIVGKGVAMKADTYAMLCQTGLCCRLAR